MQETEKLMFTHIPVSDDDLVTLAKQRGQAAKDYLTRSEGWRSSVYPCLPRDGSAETGRRARRPVDFSLK